MDIVKTGIGLTKTFKNVGRLREILTVFARNGFDEIIRKISWTSILPNFVIPQRVIAAKELKCLDQEKDWSGTFGLMFRKSFEELGPSFVKLGQLLSTREDIFEPTFIEQMKILQDQAKGLPFSEAKSIIELSLGKKIEEVFKNIDEEPIGKASIGVVFKGQLYSGEDVVIKVRRPNIAQIIQNDFEILRFLVEQFERVSAEFRYLGLSRVVKEIDSSINQELDFHIESLNCNRFKSSLGKLDEKGHFYIPQIYNQYTTKEVLVMERLKGIPFSNHREILKQKDEIQKQLNYGVQLFTKSLLQEGFFHADLHGGNFFYLDNGKIGIIDFGLMGSLGRNSRQHLIAILYSLTTHNYDNLVYEFLDVADYEHIPDVDNLIRDVKDALSPFIGLTVQQTNFSLLLNKISKTLSNHKIFLPREWFTVFRSLMTLDGVGKSIGFDIDIMGVLQNDITDIVKKTFSKEQIYEDAIWSGRDLLSAFKMVPRHIKWFLKDISKKGYKVEIYHSGYQNSIKQLSYAIAFLGHCLISILFFVTFLASVGRSGLITISSWTFVSWIFLILSLFVFAFGYRAFQKIKN